MNFYRHSGRHFVILNGDIDNYEDLKAKFEKEGNYKISPRVTTDAKIISLAVDYYVGKGKNLQDAFRNALNLFEGSHAIAMQSDLEPGKTYLALRGSGQAIYVGISPEQYVVASEVYGVVENTYQYIAMDGESPRIPNDLSTQGQIFVLDEKKSGIEGIEAYYYDGVAISLQPQITQEAEITSRDIDRENFSHYFVKEISQSPESISKTMRGKFTKKNDLLQLDAHILPEKIVSALQEGKIQKIYCTGQGTASIAASAIAYQMAQTFGDERLQIQGLKASELSGFYIQPKMQNTLIIAVTQSGTTTDTNRAVDMAKARGAYTLAIVNRRNSHITSMVDGVFYTSDGRDIEMSVASTKAFYAQVAAGEILALAMAGSLSRIKAGELARRLDSLRKLPDLLNKILQKESQIGELAARWAPRYQHWAIVGSGANRIAAEEVRIKLSELCYKSIASDCVEDKKHIDLSSEPMIIVCAAGTPEHVTGDLIKDVAIFKAHRSAPIVIVDEGETRFHPYAAGVIEVPKADPLSALILNTMAGHLFGYHAACSIHSQSLFFSGLRAPLVSGVTDHSWENVLADPEIQDICKEFTREFHKRRRDKVFTAALSASTCTDIALLLAHVCHKTPAKQFLEEFGKPATSDNLGNLLLENLNACIDELVRPIDAIKHQAKTVTVGTSRLEPTKFTGILFEALEKEKVSVSHLFTDVASRLSQIQLAISEILGSSFYKILDLDAAGRITNHTKIQLISKTGIAKDISSRSDGSPSPLAGTKKSVVREEEVFLGIGLADGRSILIIPISTQEGNICNLLLFHIRFQEKISVDVARKVLGASYEKIQNMVIESNQEWKDEYLTQIPAEILCAQGPKEIVEKISEICK